MNGPPVVALVGVEDILDAVIVLVSNLGAMVPLRKRMRATELMYIRGTVNMISTRYSMKRIRLKMDLVRII